MSSSKRSLGIIKPATVDKAMIAADPVAALLSYVGTILAVFGVFEKMGLSADQVAILGSAILGLVATARIFYERSRRAAHQELSKAHEELKRAVAQIPPEELLEPPEGSGSSQ